MRRILGALFALPLTLFCSQVASAQNYPTQFGCGGFCFKFLGGLHQHGPLYNYGPYAGYYPFEPYGPWTSSLQYNGPGLNGATCGWNGLGCGHGRNCGHGGCGAAGCSSHGFGLGLGQGLGQGQGLGLGLGNKLGLSHTCSTGTCGTQRPGFGYGQVFHPATGHGLRGLFANLRSERDAVNCDPCATASNASPLGFLRKIFERSHFGCRKAKISTGCSVAPPCPASCCEVGTEQELAKPTGGCSASAQVIPHIMPTVQTVSGFGDSQPFPNYRRER